MSDRGFPKHFDGRRFYNPGSPQARGFLDVLRWKLRSRPEPSPDFISDVEPSIPPIHAVLISHNHFDHLDLPTLRQLAARGSSTFVVAARGARLLRSQRIESVHELDWGESLAISGFIIHCVPALHFSARSILDRNKTL